MTEPGTGRPGLNSAMTGTRRLAAPSSRLAIAARSHGDDYPSTIRQWPRRTAAVVLLVSSLFYAPWMLTHLNTELLWLSVPFLMANLFSLLYVVTHVWNSWSRCVPRRRPVAPGQEPRVGVIIPTCGEGVDLVLRTVISVLEQDWPAPCLIVMVSDDAHDPILRQALIELPVTYYEPPSRHALGRDGAAKAGNLNAALSELEATHPDLLYVETRDADDEVGSNSFLREAVGQLEADDGLAYVQTIKEAQVSAGDPFNNRETMFYQGQMLSRNAANAVFPCGSGLVWRRAALRDIGGFPVWNLVEDLQSGVEALRRGWRGLYLPIVGAVGQHSPQDIPNVYKQRGTWAIDTVRLLVYGDLSGLDLRQRAHFYGMLLDYVNAFTILVYLPSVVLSLLGWTPLESSAQDYLVHLLPLVVATEVWLLLANRPFHERRSRQRRPLMALWRVRIMWAGLGPTYMKATVQAVVGGRGRKPTYRVTRKEDDHRWYWRETLPHAAAVLVTLCVLAYALTGGSLPSGGVLLGTFYWGGLYVALLAGFVPRGWHGVEWRRRALPPSPSPAGDRRRRTRKRLHRKDGTPVASGRRRTRRTVHLRARENGPR